MRKLLLLLIVSGFLLAISVAPAFAGTAYRCMSNGDGFESATFANTSAGQASALAWIKGKAKGRFDISGSTQWVVLRDTKIVHTNSSNWRGPGHYYNQYDPLLYTKGIQYTINNLHNVAPLYTHMAEDSNFGPATLSNARLFQQKNAQGVDGVIGTNSYKVMSYTSF